MKNIQIRFDTETQILISHKNDNNNAVKTGIFHPSKRLLIAGNKVHNDLTILFCFLLLLFFIVIFFNLREKIKTYNTNNR